MCCCFWRCIKSVRRFASHNVLGTLTSSYCSNCAYSKVESARGGFVFALAYGAENLILGLEIALTKYLLYMLVFNN